MERTRNSIRLDSMGCVLSTDATSSTTVAPDGMEAPLVPEMPFVTVAVSLSPGRRFTVHTREFVAMPTREPEPMMPAAGAGAAAGAGVGSLATGCGGVGCGAR